MPLTATRTKHRSRSGRTTACHDRDLEHATVRCGAASQAGGPWLRIGSGHDRARGGQHGPRHRRVIRRLTRASGADRTGLDRLLELTAAGAAADAFVAVALAGTLFFSTSVDQARGRIALTLLITMAPFAVLAPFIGPMLDRVRDGRRYIMLGTLLARGLLCWGMAGAAQHNDTVTLLPAAFGVLVLQKAYGVTRSAVTPRLLPAKITLVSANARISLAALIASALGVAAAGAISLLAGGGSTGGAWVLRVGTVVYLAAIALGIRLPNQVNEAPAPAAAEPPAASPHQAGSHGAGPNGPHGAGAHGANPYRPSEYPTDPHTVRPDQPHPGYAQPHQPYPHQGGPQRHQPPTAGHAGNGHPGHAPNGHVGADHPAAARRGLKQARWATTLRSVGPIVGEAMRGNAALRAFSGYMIFFLAFLLRTVHFAGTADKVALAEMIAAAGRGRVHRHRDRGHAAGPGAARDHVHDAVHLDRGHRGLRRVLRAVGGARRGPGGRLRPGAGQAGPRLDRAAGGPGRDPVLHAGRLGNHPPAGLGGRRPGRAGHVHHEQRGRRAGRGRSRPGRHHRGPHPGPAAAHPERPPDDPAARDALRGALGQAATVATPLRPGLPADRKTGPPVKVSLE